jgi:hypothetical protein
MKLTLKQNKMDIKFTENFHGKTQYFNVEIMAPSMADVVIGFVRLVAQLLARIALSRICMIRSHYVTQRKKIEITWSIDFYLMEA